MSQDAYTYYLRNKSCFDQQRLLSNLPEKLKESLVSSIYSVEISRIVLLQHFNMSFVADLVMLLKPFRVGAGERIFGMRDVVKEIVFITSGAVKLSCRVNADR